MHDHHVWNTTSRLSVKALKGVNSFQTASDKLVEKLKWKLSMRQTATLKPPVSTRKHRSCSLAESSFSTALRQCIRII